MRLRPAAQARRFGSVLDGDDEALGYELSKTTLGLGDRGHFPAYIDAEVRAVNAHLAGLRRGLRAFHRRQPQGR